MSSGEPSRTTVASPPLARVGGRSGTAGRAEARVGPAVVVDVASAKLAASAARPLVVRIASARGLRNRDWFPGTGVSDPYCVCEIHGKPKSRFQTLVINNCLDPVWDREYQVEGYEVGDSLEFTVYDKDFLGWRDLLGRARLQSERFHPHGFEGELQLRDVGKGGDAFLKVQVSPAPDAPPERPPQEAALQEAAREEAATARREPCEGRAAVAAEEEELRSLRARLSEAGELLQRAQNQASEQEELCGTRAAAAATEEEEVRALRAQLSEAGELWRSTQNQELCETRAVVAAKEEEVRALRAQLSEAEKLLCSAQNQVSEHADQVQELCAARAAVAAKEEEVRALRTQLSEAGEFLRSAQSQELCEVQAAVAAEEEEARALRTQLSEAGELLRGVQDKVSEREDQVQELEGRGRETQDLLLACLRELLVERDAKDRQAQGRIADLQKEPVEHRASESEASERGDQVQELEGTGRETQDLLLACLRELLVERDAKDRQAQGLIADLQKELVERRASDGEAQGLISGLQQELASSSARIMVARLLQEVADGQNHSLVATLRHELADREAQCTAAASQLQELRREISDRQALDVQREERLARLSQQLVEEQAKRREAEDTDQPAASALKQELAERGAQCAAAHSQLEELRRQLSDLQAADAQRDEQLALLSRQLAEERAKRQAEDIGQPEAAALERELATREAQNTAATSQLEERLALLSRQLAEEQAKRRAAEDTNQAGAAALRQELAEREAQCAAATSQLQELRQQLSDQQAAGAQREEMDHAAAAALRRELAAREAQCAAATSQLQELRQQLSDRQAVDAQREERLALLSQQLADEQAKHRTAEDTDQAAATVLRQELADREAQCATSISQLQERVALLSQQLADEQAKRRAAENTDRAAATALKRELFTREAHCMAVSSQLKELRRQLTDRQALDVKREERIALLSRQLAEEQAKHRAADDTDRAATATLKRHLDDRESQLRELRQQLSDRAASDAEVEKRLAFLSQQVADERTRRRAAEHLATRSEEAIAQLRGLSSERDRQHAALAEQLAEERAARAATEARLVERDGCVQELQRRYEELSRVQGGAFPGKQYVPSLPDKEKLQQESFPCEHYVPNVPDEDLDDGLALLQSAYGNKLPQDFPEDLTAHLLQQALSQQVANSSPGTLLPGTSGGCQRVALTERLAEDTDQVAAAALRQELVDRDSQLKGLERQLCDRRAADAERDRRLALLSQQLADEQAKRQAAERLAAQSEEAAAQLRGASSERNRQHAALFEQLAEERAAHASAEAQLVARDGCMRELQRQCAAVGPQAAELQQRLADRRGPAQLPERPTDEQTQRRAAGYPAAWGGEALSQGYPAAWTGEAAAQPSGSLPGERELQRRCEELSRLQARAEAPERTLLAEQVRLQREGVAGLPDDAATMRALEKTLPIEQRKLGPSPCEHRAPSFPDKAVPSQRRKLQREDSFPSDCYVPNVPDEGLDDDIALLRFAVGGKLPQAADFPEDLAARLTQKALPQRTARDSPVSFDPLPARDAVAHVATGASGREALPNVGAAALPPLIVSGRFTPSSVVSVSVAGSVVGEPPRGTACRSRPTSAVSTGRSRPSSARAAAAAAGPPESVLSTACRSRPTSAVSSGASRPGSARTSGRSSRPASGARGARPGGARSLRPVHEKDAVTTASAQTAVPPSLDSTCAYDWQPSKAAQQDKERLQLEAEHMSLLGERFALLRELELVSMQQDLDLDGHPSGRGWPREL